MKNADIESVEAELYRPAKEETCFAPPGDADRLAALRKLRQLVPPFSTERRGINTHVHTGKSFGVFFSPSAACWQAYKEGLEVFGINDHYTVAGYAEFRAACAILGLKPTFSMEAIALDTHAMQSGLLLNDPSNPGRVYFTAKGVTRKLDPAGQHARMLQRAIEAIQSRYKDMTSRAAAWLEDHTSGLAGVEPVEKFGWPEVLGRTPHGNVTERHMAGAVADRLCACTSPEKLKELCADWFGQAPESFDPAYFQTYVRSHLLKSGKPCYAPESPEAYLPLDAMRSLYLGMGAIPTYPILGNPVTEGERDAEGLIERLNSAGVYGFEVIPHRNTRERLREIVGACRRRFMPVFTGTEHNTLDKKPLLDPLSKDAEFLPYFESSAYVLLGHQKAVATSGPEAGLVTPEGEPSIKDAEERFEHFERIGRTVRA